MTREASVVVKYFDPAGRYAQDASHAIARRGAFGVDDHPDGRGQPFDTPGVDADDPESAIF